MKKSEMLEKISEYYDREFGRDNGVYAYAGVLSVFVTEENLQKIMKLNGIK
jgi:hypothetical protein